MNLAIVERDAQRIGDVAIPDIFYNRLKTGSAPLDILFGGDNPGILPGSTITLKAKPGLGKSVFSMSLANMLHNQGYNVCYHTGEEDVRQVAYNCKRLGIEDLRIGTKTDVDELADLLKNHQFMVIDSFQSLTTVQDLNATQKIKYYVDNLVSQAKLNECTLLVIVQETASGEIRGGPTLLYAVDVNLEILKNEDDPTIRLLDIYKNRFGPCTTHYAKFGISGYDFLGEYNLNDMKNNKNKVSVKETRKVAILKMDEPPIITVQRICDELGISEQTAKLLLVDLENDMKVVKFGRGPNAIWKLNLH